MKSKLMLINFLGQLVYIYDIFKTIFTVYEANIDARHYLYTFKRRTVVMVLV